MLMHEAQRDIHILVIEARVDAVGEIALNHAFAKNIQHAARCNTTHQHLAHNSRINAAAFCQRQRFGVGRTKRREIADNLNKAQELLEGPSFAKERSGRRVQGPLATVLVLRGVLLADAADAQRTWDELVKGWKALNALCEEQSGVTVDPTHLYYRVAASALLGELNKRPSTPEQRKQRLDDLRDAAQKLGTSRKHPDDIESFRAFRSLAGDPEFKKLMDALRAQGAAKAPAPAP